MSDALPFAVIRRATLFAALAAAALAWASPTAPARPPEKAPAKPPAKSCPLEENCDCPVPGVTIRWVAAYCMAVNETDDEANPAVSDCISRTVPDPKKSECEANLQLKTKICRQTRKTAAEVQACVKDASFLPYPVPEGIVGD